MIYVLLSIFCSSSIALILKYNDTKKGNEVVLLSSNYLVAALINLALVFLGNGWHLSIGTFMFGALLALLFVISFFAFAKAVNIVGTSLATISSRMSVIIPILLSIFIFNEIPKLTTLIGFTFTILTIIFFYYSIKQSDLRISKIRGYGYLLVLLLGIGISDFSLKIYETNMPEGEMQTFVFIIFASAFVYTFALIVIKKIDIRNESVLIGSTLGIPNGLSTVTLLGALTQIPAIIVFPVVNVGIVVLTTLLAYTIWREKLNNFGILALFSGLFTILLLSL